MLGLVPSIRLRSIGQQIRDTRPRMTPDKKASLATNCSPATPPETEPARQIDRRCACPPSRPLDQNNPSM
ncbi:hypothetical protein EFB14_02460 [Rhizobium fabae]|uniref:Uncharacterized protein n=1 Tax=Rhizobium fabae TaxID=573179 RepID=A0ABY0BGG8_9HYPH|nr:hypothetical protein EFB14_02460 [Rhizobium fabae]